MSDKITLSLNLLMEAMTLFSKLKEEAKRTGELTPEQEALLDRQVNERMAQIHWTY